MIDCKVFFVGGPLDATSNHVTSDVIYCREPRPLRVERDQQKFPLLDEVKTLQYRVHRYYGRVYLAVFETIKPGSLLCKALAEWMINHDDLQGRNLCREHK